MANSLRNWPEREVGVICVSSDWKRRDATHFLDRYQDQCLVYNDDIQGTASAVLAGLLTALQIKGERLIDQRHFFAGVGSAGVGVANRLVEAMIQERVDRQEARARVSLLDVNGLVQNERETI
ncbi:malic enzyme-like NAD(P)-binding protein [Pseudomonas sp. EpS/L25]|uniref:malic enzyme-like NAD(P)-binding protein n=1 Tax=Pseudomonas sp. EpS/L25 TaxID=1749078 RepID=UPI0013666139|nr:malic enzyme-like NAD(P)-binding protein [Pseudomonas sp. EpS/L25]